MSVVLTINVTDVEDAITLKEGELLSAIFDCASEVIDAGGCIVIQRKCENARSDKLYEFSTRDELEKWKSTVDDILNCLSSDNV